MRPAYAVPVPEYFLRVPVPVPRYFGKIQYLYLYLVNFQVPVPVPRYRFPYLIPTLNGHLKELPEENNLLIQK